MSQEQLCECGQRSGTNSDCTECRFVSTERELRARVTSLESQLRSEAHGHRTQSNLAAHFADILEEIASGCCDENHPPELCNCAAMRATVALNAVKMRDMMAKAPT